MMAIVRNGGSYRHFTLIPKTRYKSICHYSSRLMTFNQGNLANLIFTTNITIFYRQASIQSFSRCLIFYHPNNLYIYRGGSLRRWNQKVFRMFFFSHIYSLASTLGPRQVWAISPNFTFNRYSITTSNNVIYWQKFKITRKNYICTTTWGNTT